MMEIEMDGSRERDGWVFLVSNAAVHDSTDRQTDRQSWKTDARSIGRSVARSVDLYLPNHPGDE
jgi:hypothetical protein